MSTHLTTLLQTLWQDFTTINRQAESIHQILEMRGERIINDHIAFRTLADPRVNIDVLAQPFVAAGYSAEGEYHFEQKRLDARHFEHSDPQFPTIFISELRLQECSDKTQSVLQDLLAQVPESTWKVPAVCSLGRPWDLNFETYEYLAQESEYAAWFAAWGFRANHFTVLVNALKSVSGLAQLNELIKASGFRLNTEGGEIKGSPDVYLAQSSTVASQVDVEFRGEPRRIPGCYYEFAQRFPLPSGELFSGFVTSSADKIFQSTDRQTSFADR